MMIHVLALWGMELYHRLLIFPEERFDKAHFVPRRCPVLRGNRNVLPGIFAVPRCRNNKQCDAFVLYLESTVKLSRF